MTNEIPKQKEDLDFEIHFLEGVITKQPNFIEALVVLGELYTKKGLYQKGLEIDRRLSQLKPDDPIVFYNLACSYSLIKDMDKAFAAIQFAMQNGYNDFEHLMKDQDLKNLREDNRFQSLSEKFSKRVPARGQTQQEP